MTEQQKERMIALLIKAVDEAELCELLKLYDKSESNICKARQ